MDEDDVLILVGFVCGVIGTIFVGGIIMSEIDRTNELGQIICDEQGNQLNRTLEYDGVTLGEYNVILTVNCKQIKTYSYDGVKVEVTLD